MISRRALSSFLAGLALAIAAPAFAQPAPNPAPATMLGYRPRFLPLDQRIVSRMSARKQAAVRGVAQLRNASGFIVHEDGNGKALLLTNEHVTRSGVTAGETIKFFDGHQARTSRLLYSNPQLDYGLIEIDLPASGASRELQLEPAGLSAGRHVYAIAGFANLGFKDLDSTVAGGPQVHGAIRGGQVNHFSLAPGRVFDDEYSAQSIRTGGTTILGKLSLMPNAPGMSGSPVFSRNTHTVVGLHSSGNGSPAPYWEETAVPLALIMQDLSARLASGVFDPQAHALVDALLKKAAP